MSKIITKQMFVNKAVSVHGNKYDYTLFVYKTAKTKSKIICKKHGIFEQNANNHLNGQGCQKCSGTYVPTTDEFIVEVSKLHNKKYDYSKVNYINNRTKITIICPIHGEFKQTPAGHKTGKGCKKCGVQIIKEKSQKTCLDRFGTKYPIQLEEIKNKRKETWLKKYKVVNPFLLKENQQKRIEKINSKEVKEKTKQTNLKRYGKENFTSTQEFLDKRKKTYIERYGVENPSNCKEIRKKIKQTNLQKYGVDFYTKTDEFKNKLNKLYSTYFIIETGDNLINWYKNQPEPKPSLNIIYKNFNKQIHLSEINEFVQNYKSNKTSLEILGEKLFNVPHYNKFILNYKPDFKLSETVYINVDGLYWHSEINRSKYSHFQTRKDFEDNNLRLFQFYENEIRYKPEIVKNIIKGSINNSFNKINVDDCEIKIVNQKEAEKFLEENNLSGSIKAKHVGLYYKNKLVSIISYKEKCNFCNIKRFCNLINTDIDNGFSKLIKYIECNLLKSSTRQLFIYVDLRYETGKHLENNGFNLIKEKIDWKWTNCRKIFNKNIQQPKFFKIYDAGQRLYIKNLNI